MATDPVELATALVRAPSVTPRDHGCQTILIRHLEALGFTIHRLRFGQVENFYARRGQTAPNFCFAGHSDVVGPGDASLWRSPPFDARVADGELVGRGICDMKGALAAMAVAVEGFLTAHPGFGHTAAPGSLSFLITGDEEGDALDGTVRVLDWLQQRGETLDWCLVGEPTASAVVGDCVKNGRRGSLNGRIVFQGIQGHVAYPHRALNPIHAALGALKELADHVFDTGNADFEPTSVQFTGLSAGDGSTNVVPGLCEAAFNIRFNTEQTPASLTATLQTILDRAVAAVPGGRFSYHLETTVSGLPFRSRGGPLLEAIHRVRGTQAPPLELSTGGGTSDARFIARVCPQTFEWGLVGTTMHKVDERCPVADLHHLTALYQRLLEELFDATSSA
ncbi:MAG: succinyl-diaminopimelate desuccinylase [Magnetococcales bacterium]|nr:succinyl-diaminopimelate desuccinylase [Magnetococcales bacterium]